MRNAVKCTTYFKIIFICESVSCTFKTRKLESNTKHKEKVYSQCLSCPISPFKPHFSAIIFICGLQEMLLYMLHWSRDPLSSKILILTCLSAQSVLPFCEWSSSTIWERQSRVGVATPTLRQLPYLFKRQRFSFIEFCISFDSCLCLKYHCIQ